jgi:hypothetical protein
MYDAGSHTPIPTIGGARQDPKSVLELLNPANIPLAARFLYFFGAHFGSCGALPAGYPRRWDPVVQ